LSDPVPKNWKDAVPSVLFGFYGLGFALEAVAAMNRGDINLFIWDSIACTLLTPVAVIWWKYRDWLPIKFVSTANLVIADARWLIGAASVFLIASALAPYIGEQRWPFIREIVLHDATTAEDIEKATAPIREQLNRKSIDLERAEREIGTLRATTRPFVFSGQGGAGGAGAAGGGGGAPGGGQGAREAFLRRPHFKKRGWDRFGPCE
jgi:hypothetical protein